MHNMYIYIYIYIDICPSVCLNMCIYIDIYIYIYISMYENVFTFYTCRHHSGDAPFKGSLQQPLGGGPSRKTLQAMIDPRGSNIVRALT